MAATGTGRAAHLVDIFVKAEQGRVRVEVGKRWTRDPDRVSICLMRAPGIRRALIPVARTKPAAERVVKVLLVALCVFRVAPNAPARRARVRARPALSCPHAPEDVCRVP